MKLKLSILIIMLELSFGIFAMEEKKINKGKIGFDLPFNPMNLIASVGGSREELLLAKAMFFEDEIGAYKIYSSLADQASEEEWHGTALLFKGNALMFGKGVEEDQEEALKCYRECYAKHRDCRALLGIGQYYDENHTIENNFKLAAIYYKKAFDNKELMGGFNYARLLFLEKIEFETENPLEEILCYLRPIVFSGADNPLILQTLNDAFVLYAGILLDNNLDDEFISIGLPALHIAAQQGDAYAMQQLGILYRHGLYVEKDILKSQLYFEKALNSEDTQANLATKACMYMRGDGVIQDRKYALELLEQARDGESNIQDIFDHFGPEIEEIQKAHSDVIYMEKRSFSDKKKVWVKKTDTAADPIIEVKFEENATTDIKIDNTSTNLNIRNNTQITAQSQKPKKRRSRKKRASNQAQLQVEIKSLAIEPKSEQAPETKLTSSIKQRKRSRKRNKRAIYNVLDTLRVSRNIPKSFPYETITQKCNKLSTPVDGSWIEIDANKQIVLIHDPKYKKEFSFQYDSDELHYDVEPAPFKYDDRINLQLNATGGNMDPHKFGSAADYMIQLFGVLNPYLSRKKKDDNLIHSATLLARIKQQGHFQYTFFRSKNDFILYHRLFKKMPKTLNSK